MSVKIKKTKNGIIPILISGSSSPNFNGLYEYGGQYNGKNYYYCPGVGYIWWLISGYWILSASLGVQTFDFYYGGGTNPPVGDASWNPQIGASGTVFSNDGSDISSSIDWESINLNSVLTKEVSTFQFLIKETVTKATIVLGDQIDIYEDQISGNVHIFGGTVTEAETTVIGGLLLGMQVTVTDWSFQLNGKLVAKSYANQDPQTIVQDIISTFTTGFTTTNVKLGGFDVVSISFNYEQVTSALEKLAKLIGWEWYIDPDKDVHFFPPGTDLPAPFGVDDTSGNQWWQTIDVDKNLQNMKNSVFVIGGNYAKTFTSATTPDIFKTDGVQFVFALAYPYDESTIVVTLDGVAQTVAPITNPGSAQVLYSNSGKFIQFVSVPATGKTVNVSGDAVLPIIAQASNQMAIVAYGEIQDCIVDKNIKSTEEAQQRANAEIARYGSPVYSITFTTIKTGLIVGQTLTFNSAKFGVTTSIKITRITGTGRTPNQFQYAVECVSTDSVTFINIMKVLLAQNQATNPADASAIIEKLIVFLESMGITDAISATGQSGPYNWDAVNWDFFTWA